MSPADSDIVIVSVGARTPLGLTAASSAAAVRGAISVINKHPYFVDKEGEPMRLTRDAILPIELAATGRCVDLARSAFVEAIRPLVQNDVSFGVIPTIIGFPDERPGRSSDLEQLVTKDLTNVATELGLSLHVQTAAHGHSAGLMALDAAVRRIRSGEIQLCLVGGVDSYLQGETLEWLDQNRQLMSGANRSGFPPGEGSAFCLMARWSFAQRVGWVPLGSVASVVTTMEKNRIKTETICLGEGLTAAIRGACAPLDSSARRVEQTWCDMNGERYRSTRYTYALTRNETLFDKTRIGHPADCWGDVGAASGPLFVCLSVDSWSRGYAKGPRALLWTSSESGYRSAAVLQQVNSGQVGSR